MRRSVPGLDTSALRCAIFGERETINLPTTHHLPLTTHHSLTHNPPGQASIERRSDIGKTGGKSKSRVPECADFTAAVPQGRSANHPPILRAPPGGDEGWMARGARRPLTQRRVQSGAKRRHRHSDSHTLV